MSQGALHKFYCSKEWADFRQMIIQDRSKDGVICEECGEIILDASQIHIHHIIELTEHNYKNKMISLNPQNVKMVSKECHDRIHKRFSKGAVVKKNRGIYLVCGPPMAGKRTFVKQQMETGDIVVDMDKLYQAVSYLEEYNKPDNLRFNVFAIRNLLIDNIRTRYGNFKSAWVIGGYPNKVERDQLAYKLGAEIILLEVSKMECIARLDSCMGYRSIHKGEWKRYIEEWFERFSK